MVTRELLKIVESFLKDGARHLEIKVSLKKNWKEKDIDEAIWWFEYYEEISQKSTPNYTPSSFS